MASYTKLGLAGIGLCGLCCGLPVIGAIIGIGSITAVGYYLDKISIALITLAIIVFIYTFFRKRKGAARQGAIGNVANDCNCSDRKTEIHTH